MPGAKKLIAASPEPAASDDDTPVKAPMLAAAPGRNGMNAAAMFTEPGVTPSSVAVAEVQPPKNDASGAAADAAKSENGFTVLRPPLKAPHSRTTCCAVEV